MRGGSDRWSTQGFVTSWIAGRRGAPGRAENSGASPPNARKPAREEGFTRFFGKGYNSASGAAKVAATALDTIDQLSKNPQPVGGAADSAVLGCELLNANSPPPPLVASWKGFQMPRLRSSVWTAAACLFVCSGCYYSPWNYGGYRNYGVPGPAYGTPYGYPAGGIQTLPPGSEYLPGNGATPTFAPGTNQLTPIPDGSGTDGASGGSAPLYNPGTRQVPEYPDENDSKDLQQPIEGAPLKESNAAGASLDAPATGWGSEGVEQTAGVDALAPAPRQLNPTDVEAATPMGEPVDAAPLGLEELPSDLVAPTDEVPLSPVP